MKIYNIKTSFTILCFLVLGSALKAQDTTRILFIGNSFTYQNNMPQMVKAFSDSAHLPVIIGMHAPGGISVGDTVQGTMAHWKNPQLFQLIRSKKWDFAVIQDNQGRFIRDSAVFSPASMVIQGHLNIMDSVKKNNDCAKIILFGGWAWKAGSPPFGNTGIETMQRIMVNYCVLNDTMKEVIAPIAEAWIKSSSQMPSVDLWDFDGAHPSYAGSYLTASVIFSTIFNSQAKPVLYNGTLLPANGLSLRTFADSAVFGLSFHKRYNLGGVKKLVPVFSNGQLSIPGNYASYTWYKNNMFFSNSPVLNIASMGNYKAIVKENDGCLIKTCGYTELLITEVPEEDFLNKVLVVPNPVTADHFFISSEKELENVSLFNISGTEEKIRTEKTTQGLQVFISALKPGCYVLRFSAKGQDFHKKLIVNH